MPIPAKSLLAIDPGVHATGVAVFFNEALVNPFLQRATSLEEMIFLLSDHLGYYDEVVVERPTVYSRNSKGAPDDLIRVALVAGAAATHSREIALVEPRTWKGQTPKAIHHRRVRAALTPIELPRLQVALDDSPASLRHNVLDAVGLGLWQLGRLSR